MKKSLENNFSFVTKAIQNKIIGLTEQIYKLFLVIIFLFQSNM